MLLRADTVCRQWKCESGSPCLVLENRNVQGALETINFLGMCRKKRNQQRHSEVWSVRWEQNAVSMDQLTCTWAPFPSVILLVIVTGVEWWWDMLENRWCLKWGNSEYLSQITTLEALQHETYLFPSPNFLWSSTKQHLGFSPFPSSRYY